MALLNIFIEDLGATEQIIVCKDNIGSNVSVSKGTFERCKLIFFNILNLCTSISTGVSLHAVYFPLPAQYAERSPCSICTIFIRCCCFWDQRRQLIYPSESMTQECASPRCGNYIIISLPRISYSKEGGCRCLFTVLSECHCQVPLPGC